MGHSSSAKLTGILLAYSLLPGLTLSPAAAATQVLGQRDMTFATGVGVTGQIHDLVLQPDGRAVLFGGFDDFNGVQVGRAVRLNTDGSRDASFSLPFTGIVRAVALQPDGSFLIGGNYVWALANNFTRVLGNGAIDVPFLNGIGSGASDNVGAVAVDSIGRILVGGHFQHFSGHSWPHLVRLEPDGTIDTTFDVQGGPNAQVRAIEVLPDGRMLVGGIFTTFGGGPCNRLVRLLESGQIDSSFNVGSGFNLAVNDIALQPDGKAIVAGAFTSFNGTPVGRIARLETDGSLDTSFAPNGGANFQLNAVAVLPSGRIVIGGDLSSFGGGAAYRFAMLTPLGELVPEFQSSNVLNGPVTKVVPVSDNQVLLGGSFSHHNGTLCGGILRLWSNYVCFVDADGDGFGTGPALYHGAPCGAGFAPVGGDCDDSQPSVFPGAAEICDGLDNDCDGLVDPGFITTYCTAGTTVGGCVPDIAGVGAPSTQSTSGFEIVITQVPAQRFGIIFCSRSAAAPPHPWAPGSSSFVCIQVPTARTATQETGGIPGTCTGELRVDFNAFMAARPNALGTPFQAGQVLHAQGWFRDPGAAKQTNLSDALTFTLCN